MSPSSSCFVALQHKKATATLLLSPSSSFLSARRWTKEGDGSITAVAFFFFFTAQEGAKKKATIKLSLPSSSCFVALQHKRVTAVLLPSPSSSSSSFVKLQRNKEGHCLLLSF
jgi:hypothetical protein